MLPPRDETEGLISCGVKNPLAFFGIGELTENQIIILACIKFLEVLTIYCILLFLLKSFFCIWSEQRPSYLFSDRARGKKPADHLNRFATFLLNG